MMQRDVSNSISVTTGPIVGSTKVYIDGVPIRRVNLSNGEHLDLYDTSGPYTDPDAVIDLHAGLPPRRGVVRDDMIAARKLTELTHGVLDSGIGRTVATRTERLLRRPHDVVPGVVLAEDAARGGRRRLRRGNRAAGALRDDAVGARAERHDGTDHGNVDVAALARAADRLREDAVG